MDTKPKDRWWLLDKGSDTVAKSAFSTLMYLDELQAQRRTVNLMHLRLYSNRAAMSMSGRDFAQSAGDSERIRMNVVKSCIDAATAQIGSNRPRPMFKTVDGDFSMRQRAKGLGRFCMGQFHALKQYSMSRDIFLDGCIFGTGIEHIYQEAGRVCIERVFPDEMFVDDNDGRMRNPRQFFRHKEVSREVLQADFGLTDDEARGAKRIRDLSADIGIVEPASVVEAWHLPSNYDAKDGRHIVCISDKVLVDEAWTKPYPPFAFFRWNISPIGFWGMGVAEELAPIQVEINYLAQKIQRLMTLATSVMFTKKGEAMRKISNRDWGQYEYTNTPPEFRNIPPVAGEYFQHMDRLYQRAFEIVGISQLQAQSLKPAGLDSGEALRVYNDIGTRRFQHTAQMWEQFHLDVSELLVDCAREAEEEGHGSMEVLTAGDREVQQISFSEVSVDKTKYVLQVWPTNLLPDSPAGKVAQIKELAQALPEQIQPHVLKLMTGIPDVEKVVSLETAALDYAERCIDMILTTGEYEPPYGGMDLMLTGKMATQAILRAKMDGVPEERIALLEQFRADIDKLLTPPPQAAQDSSGASGQATPAGALPGAAPGAPAGMQMLPPDSMPPVPMQPPPPGSAQMQGPMGPML